jgi:protein tyrosine phosphatase (PTP) superfamily phosphohydrolase (DUF442 family)
MSIEQAYNFIQIDELVSSSGSISEIALIDEGFHLVVNLLPNDNEHARATEKQEFESLGVDYEYVPVDWNNPQIEAYESFESILKHYQNKKIHVHCAANFRATAFYGVYGYRNLGWSEMQLYDLIASIWNIEEYPLWEKYVSDLITAEYIGT